MLMERTYLPFNYLLHMNLILTNRHNARCVMRLPKPIVYELQFQHARKSTPDD